MGHSTIGCTRADHGIFTDLYTFFPKSKSSLAWYGRARERSLRDSLTGLPNRDLLHDRLKQALSQSHREGTRHAGYFLDLDGFKKVNDRLGARRLLFQVESCVIEGVAKNSLSASIGICLTPYPGASVTDLIARADKAMYRAKNSGRGRYLLAATPAETLAFQRSLGEQGIDQILVV